MHCHEYRKEPQQYPKLGKCIELYLLLLRLEEKIIFRMVWLIRILLVQIFSCLLSTILNDYFFLQLQN